MCWIRPWPWARLMIIAALYWRSMGWLNRPVAHRFGPAAEQVDVAAVVHQVGQAGARRPRPDLAENDLAVRACGTTPCA